MWKILVLLGRSSSDCHGALPDGSNPLQTSPTGNPKVQPQRGSEGVFLGMLFGAVSSPCAIPVLAGTSAFIATKAKVVYGTSLLFFYAVGHRVLIVLAGIFAGFMENYVKSKGVSNFSNLTKIFSGILICLAGIYILYTNV